jgi:hypothetical protein
MREFVSAGGELIIHGALHIKKLPDPSISYKHCTMRFISKKLCKGKIWSSELTNFSSSELI